MKKLLLILISSCAIMLASCEGEDNYIDDAKVSASRAVTEYIMDKKLPEYYEDLVDLANKQIARMADAYEKKNRASYDGLLPYGYAEMIMGDLGLSCEDRIISWNKIVNDNVKRYGNKISDLYETIDYSGAPRLKLYSWKADTDLKVTVNKLLTNIEKPKKITNAYLDTLACSTIYNLYDSVAGSLRITSVDSYSWFNLPDISYPVSKKDVKKYYVVYLSNDVDITAVCSVTITKNGDFYTKII